MAQDDAFHQTRCHARLIWDYNTILCYDHAKESLPNQPNFYSFDFRHVCLFDPGLWDLRFWPILHSLLNSWLMLSRLGGFLPFRIQGCLSTRFFNIYHNYIFSFRLWAQRFSNWMILNRFSCTHTSQTTIAFSSCAQSELAASNHSIIRHSTYIYVLVWPSGLSHWILGLVGRIRYHGCRAILSHSQWFMHWMHLIIDCSIIWLIMFGLRDFVDARILHLWINLADLCREF